MLASEHIVQYWLNNKWVISVLAVVLAAYGGLAAPKLSSEATRIMTSDWFKAIIIFLVAYIPAHNFHLALMLAGAFVVSTIVFSEFKTFEFFENYRNQAE